MTGGAQDPAVIHYYDRRAAEYDDWYLGEGLFAERDRPGWDAELAAVVNVIESLDSAPRSISRELRGGPGGSASCGRFYCRSRRRPAAGRARQEGGRHQADR